MISLPSSIYRPRRQKEEHPTRAKSLLHGNINVRMKGIKYLEYGGRYVVKVCLNGVSGKAPNFYLFSSGMFLIIFLIVPGQEIFFQEVSFSFGGYQLFYLG